MILCRKRLEKIITNEVISDKKRCHAGIVASDKGILFFAP